MTPAAATATSLVLGAALAWPDRRRTVRRRLAQVSRATRVSRGAEPASSTPPGPAGALSALPPGAGRLAGAAALAAFVLGHALAAVVLAVLAVAFGVPGRQGRLEDASVAARTARDLPRAADLLATCLATGLAPPAALRVVADAVGGPVAERLRAAAAGWQMGIFPGVPARSGRPDPVDRLVRGLRRAAQTGAPLADTVLDLAADERDRARWDALEGARRAGVQAVGPLAACFLPAFVLLGVLPVVVGIATQVLTGWS
jgi:pilus assembly protein TadC